METRNRRTADARCPRHGLVRMTMAISADLVTFACPRKWCRHKQRVPRCWANVTQDGRGEWRVAS